MKKQLLLCAIAFAAFGYASAADYVAQELDGRLIRITNNVNTSSHIAISGDHLATTTSTDPALSAWLAEYDADEDGIIFSQNGKYMGCIPVTLNGVNNREISWTGNKDDAGRWRLYSFDDGATYCLTTTKLDNGSDNTNIGVNGGAGENGGFWAQGASEEGHIVRWGSWHVNAHWTYSLADEMQIEITIGENGTGVLQNYSNGAYGNQGTWNRRWISNTTPALQLETTVNNMCTNGNNIGLAPGSGGCDYTITYDDPSWYIAKVEFDFIASGGAPTITVDDVTTTATTSETRHLTIERTYGQTVTFHEAGTNNAINTSNFIVTLRKVTKQDIIDGLQTLIPTMEEYKELYSHYPDIWDASVIDGVIADLGSGANIPDWITPEVIANNSADMAIKAVNVTADGKTVNFRNLKHNTRYMSIGENSNGALFAHTTDNPDELQAVWTLIYDADANGFRISNSATDEMEIAAIPNQNEVPVPMAAAGEGHIFAINPIYANYTVSNHTYDDYVVEIWDMVGTGTHYLHCGAANVNQIPAGGNRVVRWNSAQTADASGWYISEVIIENQLDAIKAMEGQDVVITKIIEGENNPYLSVPTGSETTDFTDNLRPTSIWRISVSNINKVQNTATIALQNLLSGKWTTNLTSLSATRATSLKIDDVPEMLETWHIINTAVTPNEVLGTFSIKPLTDEQKADMVTELQGLYNPATNIGNEPGLYAFANPDGVDSYHVNKAIVDALNPEEPVNYATIAPLFDFIDNNPLSLFDINAIAGPALIRMAYTPDTNTGLSQWGGTCKVTDHNAGDTSLAMDNEGAVFVLADRKLYSLNSGHGVINRNNFPSMHTDDDDIASNLEAFETDFTDNQKTALVNVGDGVHRHGYTIRVNDADHHTFGGSSGTPHLHRVSGFGTPNPNNANSPVYPSAPKNWAYTVWYVKELNVTVKDGENQFKLWRTPVAVAYEGTETAPAYTVAVDGVNITTTPVGEGIIYGAGTTFILTDDITFAVKNGLDVEAQTVGLGHHALQNHTMTPDNIYFTIHADTRVQAPARRAPREGAPTLKMQVIAPEADTQTTLGANEAVIAVAKTENHNDIISKGALNLTLGDTTDTTTGTTGINELNAEKAANVIYDLQGRRLAAPVKGLNIINGKKILVK